MIQSGWWFQIFLNFHPYLGKWSNLTNTVFLNHQLAIDWGSKTHGRKKSCLEFEVRGIKITDQFELFNSSLSSLLQNSTTKDILVFKYPKKYLETPLGLGFCSAYVYSFAFPPWVVFHLAATLTALRTQFIKPRMSIPKDPGGVELGRCTLKRKILLIDIDIVSSGSCFFRNKGTHEKRRMIGLKTGWWLMFNTWCSGPDPPSIPYQSDLVVFHQEFMLCPLGVRWSQLIKLAEHGVWMCVEDGWDLEVDGFFHKMQNFGLWLCWLCICMIVYVFVICFFCWYFIVSRDL